MATSRSTRTSKSSAKGDIPEARATRSRPKTKRSRQAISQPPTPDRTSTKPGRTEPVQPTLLSGGNPQIAKADGDAPVQAYIAAIPGWKQPVAYRLDSLITSLVPNLRKAVRWNSPFYGIQPDGKTNPGWFLCFHCYNKFLKVAFLRGSSLSPLPPVESKQKFVRYLHIFEGDWGTSLDEKILRSWIVQASNIPGELLF